MDAQLLLDLPLDPDRRRRPLDPSKPRSPCGMCRASADTFRPGCPRCELRRSLYAVDTPEERAAWAANLERQQERMDERHAKESARFERLKALGRPVRVALVGCGTRKRSSPCLARDLYIGPLTRSAIRYAAQAADEFWILSALYGLLDPDRVIEPYDRRLPTRLRERLSWGSHTSSALAGEYAGLDVSVEVLAGADYAGAVSFPRHWAVSFPLEHLSIGQRLRWLSERAG